MWGVGPVASTDSGLLMGNLEIIQLGKSAPFVLIVAERRFGSLTDTFRSISNKHGLADGSKHVGARKALVVPHDHEESFRSLV